MTEEELREEFGGKGWKQLPDTVVKRYHFTPAKIIVDDHHIGVYACKQRRQTSRFQELYVGIPFRIYVFR